MQAAQPTESDGRRMDAALDAMAVGVVLLDGDGVPQRCNRAARSLLGMEPDAHLTRDRLEQRTGLNPRRTLDTGESTVKVVERPDGGVVECRLAPVDDGCLVELHDLSGLAARRRESLRMVSRVSHELRTPLSALRGLCDLLLEGGEGELPPGASDGVERMRRAVDRLLRMTRDALGLGRSDAGTLTSRRRAMDLAELLRDQVAVLSPDFSEEGVEVVQVVEASAAGTVWADRDQVAQVVLNLLSNALKVSAPGAEVEVHARAEPDGGRWRDAVRVSVLDRGPGIPEELRGRLFEPFTPGAGGNGLGLAICKELVDRHRGRIWCEDRDGGGTAVHVTLPRDLRGTDRDREARTRCTAVVADDDPATARSVADMLRTAGVADTVLVAGDGEEAWDLVRTRPVDLLVTDFRMPHLGGTELLRRVARDHAAVARVIMTGWRGIYEEADAHRDGADEHLPKPVDAVELAAAARRALEAAAERIGRPARPGAAADA